MLGWRGSFVCFQCGDVAGDIVQSVSANEGTPVGGLPSANSLRITGQMVSVVAIWTGQARQPRPIRARRHRAPSLFGRRRANGNVLVGGADIGYDQRNCSAVDSRDGVVGNEYA